MYPIVYSSVFFRKMYRIPERTLEYITNNLENIKNYIRKPAIFPSISEMYLKVRCVKV